MRRNYANGTCRYCPCESLVRGKRICHNCQRRRKWNSNREWRHRQILSSGQPQAKQWIQRAAALCDVLAIEPELFEAYRRHLRVRGKLKRNLDKLIAANMEKYNAAISHEKRVRSEQTQGLPGVRGIVLPA